jgi:hypothetical protein
MPSSLQEGWQAQRFHTIGVTLLAAYQMALKPSTRPKDNTTRGDWGNHHLFEICFCFALFPALGGKMEIE